MTDHPCKDLTKAQREAFERIAVNLHPENWSTIDALIKAGVVEKHEGEKRRDALGVYTVPVFSVPIHIHAQWCAWCSEQKEQHG